jgi:hypothetical protein
MMTILPHLTVQNGKNLQSEKFYFIRVAILLSSICTPEILFLIPFFLKIFEPAEPPANSVCFGAKTSPRDSLNRIARKCRIRSAHEAVFLSNSGSMLIVISRAI